MSLYVSIIIPTYNRNDLLAACLDCLYPAIQREANIDYEIIVTDDSKDNIAKKLIEEDYPKVRWIEGPKNGPAANRNNGAKKSNGDWLVFLDDDCLPQKDWLTSYISVINNAKGTLVFEGRTDADRPKERFDEEAPINTTGGNLWSCNFAINKSFFNNLGGFDETFPYAAMEDIDFHVRVKQLTTIVFVANAFVIHPWRRVKPYSTFMKHLKSHKHFSRKYKLFESGDFRVGRIKIFIGSLYYDLKSLTGFSMRGWQHYIEKSLLNFCLIFM